MLQSRTINGAKSSD